MALSIIWKTFIKQLLSLSLNKYLLKTKSYFILCLQSDTDVDQIDNENNNNNNDENRFDLLAALMRNQ